MDHAITLGRLGIKNVRRRTFRSMGILKDAIGSEMERAPLGVYGADADGIRKLVAERPAAGVSDFHRDLPYIAAEVVWGAGTEIAQECRGCSGAKDTGFISECAGGGGDG